MRGGTRFVYFVAYTYTDDATVHMANREVTVSAEVTSIVEVRRIEQKIELVHIQEWPVNNPHAVGPVTVLGLHLLRKER